MLKQRKAFDYKPGSMVVFYDFPPDTPEAEIRAWCHELAGVALSMPRPSDRKLIGDSTNDY